ncbi:hypothetical protein PFISCL1PPCAC_9604, partial [Pristionchus fissidentatus]
GRGQLLRLRPRKMRGSCRRLVLLVPRVLLGRVLPQIPLLGDTGGDRECWLRRGRLLRAVLPVQRLRATISFRTLSRR